jgi:predicted PurR-regulated permease PerM
MLEIDDRTLRAVWTVFLFGLLLAVLYFIRDTILLFALAIFFAYMLSPLLALIERFIPRRRNLALALVYFLLIGALVAIGFQVIPAIGEQATTLATRLPSLITSAKLTNLPLPSWLEPSRAQMMGALNREAVLLESSVVPFIQRTSTRLLSGLSYVLPIILIPILAFFFLKDGEEIRVNLIGAVESGHDRTTIELILDDVHVVLKSYIRALVLLSMVSFTAWLIFLSLMRYPYDLLLAGVAGLLEFIPVFGPASALVIMLIVCGVSGSGGLLWIVVFWGCYRVFQDYVLNPYLMSAGVELHPLLVLFGVLAGNSLAGIPGMFFSIPAIAILKVIYARVRLAYRNKQRAKVSEDSAAAAIAGRDSPPSTRGRDLL